MNNFLKKIIFAVSLTALLGGGFCAQAEDVKMNLIDVEYPVGINLNGNNIFRAENIYPGWRESKTISIRNKDEAGKMNVYFKFDVSGNKLAKKLKLYVVRIKDNSYRIGGSGDRWTLDDADGKDLYVDRLDAGETTKYKIKIKFDEDAGNEYQGLKSKFDIKFEAEFQPATLGITESENEKQILEEQEKRKVSGIEPKQLGEESSNGNNNGQVSGEEMSCHSLPRWVWILATLAFLGLSLFSTQKTGREKIKKHFIWQLGGVAGAILLWYLFDKCQYYKWFPVAVIVIGILNHLYYQKFKASKKV